MASADLNFNIAALDRASQTFVALGERVDRLGEKLDRLDRKRVNAEVNVDIDKGLANVGRFADSSSGIMAGALKIVSANVILMGAAVVAGLAALPAVAAAAATGITLAFGGGLAAIGIAVAAQNERVGKAFTKLKDEVLGTLREISRPFVGTLVAIADVARETFRAFVPALESSFKILAPAVERFARDFGRAFQQLAPALRPLSQAFSALLRELGPLLVPLFRDIASALTDLAGVVRRNADEFAGFVAGMLKLIPLAIVAIAKLAGWFVTLKDRIGNAFNGGVREITLFKKTFAPIISDVVRLIRQHWGPIKEWVRRNFAIVRDIIRDVLAIIRNLWDRWGDNILRIAKTVWKTVGGVIEGALRVIRGVVRIALGLLRGDWRQVWNGIKDIVRGVWQAIKSIVRGAVGVVKEIVGTAWRGIRDVTRRIWNGLRSVVSGAMSRVRSAVSGAIDRVKSVFRGFVNSGPVRAIKSAFDGIKSVIDSVTDAVGSLIDAINSIPKPDLPDLPSFDVPGLASGGRARAGRVHLVGEEGPELFVPDTSGTVIPNDQLSTGGGVTIEHLEVKSIGPRFDLQQVMDSLAWRVAS